MRVFLSGSCWVSNRGICNIIFTNSNPTHGISSIAITHSNRITKVRVILFTNSDRGTTFCFGLVTHCSCKVSIDFRFTTDCYGIATSCLCLSTNGNCIYRVSCGVTTNSDAITTRISHSIMANTNVISTSSPTFTPHSNRELTASSILICWIRICTITNSNRIITRSHRYIADCYRRPSFRFIIGTKCGGCTTSCLITITNSYCRVFCRSICRPNCYCPPIIISCILITYNNRIRAYMVTTIVCTVWRNINRAIP